MYLGTSFYQAIKASMRDNKWFIRQIAKRGGNATEFFILFTWQYRYSGVSMPYIQRGFFEDNKYPGVKFPMWDLDQFNEKIWDKWRKIFAYCKEWGITPFVRIEDYCSFKTAYNKRMYFNYASYQRNVLRKLEYMSECCRAEAVKIGDDWVCTECGFSCVPIKVGKKWFVEYTWDARARLIEKVVTTLFEAGFKRGQFKLVAMNECNMLGNIDNKKWCVDYHNFFAKELRKLKVSPKKHMIVSTMYGADELRKKGYRIEIHGINSPQRLHEKWNEGCFPNGDGQDPFADGYHGTTLHKREPAHWQGIEMGEHLARWSAFGYCYFNRNTEKRLPAKLRRAKFDALEGLVEGSK